MRLTDDSIRGRTVITSDGHVVGEIAALYIDARARHVQAFRVKLSEDAADALGAERWVFHAGELELPVLMVRSIGETVTLGIPLSMLRHIFARLSEHISHGLIVRPPEPDQPSLTK